MTVKHSPGPWTYDPDKGYPSGYGNESTAIVDSNGEIVLITDPSMGEYEFGIHPESPNISLIVAAPDLLIALKMLKQWVYTEVRHFDANEPDEFIKQAVNAAINKAENIQYQSS